MPCRTSALSRFGLPRVNSLQISISCRVQYPMPMRCLSQMKAMLLGTNPQARARSDASSCRCDTVHISKRQSLAAMSATGRAFKSAIDITL